MAAKNMSKILAALIRAYRASWVKATEATMGSTNIRQALFRAILGSGAATTKTNLVRGKPDDILKIVSQLSKQFQS